MKAVLIAVLIFMAIVYVGNGELANGAICIALIFAIGFFPTDRYRGHNDGDAD